MDYFKLIAIILGATGFWRLVEVFLNYRQERKLKHAQAYSFHTQAQDTVVENWVQWSQKLEQRVAELEAVSSENKELKAQIERQRVRIKQLEKKVEALCLENKQLKAELDRLNPESV